MADRLPVARMNAKFFRANNAKAATVWKRILYLRRLRVFRAAFSNNPFSPRFSIAQKRPAWEIIGQIYN
jgi:hypothetical protein